MSRWYDGIDPVTVPIRCGEAVHRLSWRRGKLVLEDHHLTAERAVQAMGGAPCPCAEVLEAWAVRWNATRHLMDLLCLVDEADGVARRPAYDLPPWGNYQPARPPPGMDPKFVAMFQRMERERYLRSIVPTLPAPLLARCILGALMGAERRWFEGPADDRLTVEESLLRQARRCAVLSMRSWRRLDGVALALESRLTERNGKRELSGYINSRQAAAVVQVPLSWFVTVLARNRAVVDGCFVLDATDGPDGVDATVVRWERIGAFASEAVTVPARLWRVDGGTWRLRWA